jgi:hypothetical protein
VSTVDEVYHTPGAKESYAHPLSCGVPGPGKCLCIYSKGHALGRTVLGTILDHACGCGQYWGRLK